MASPRCQLRRHARQVPEVRRVSHLSAQRGEDRTTSTDSNPYPQYEHGEQGEGLFPRRSPGDFLAPGMTNPLNQL